MTQFNYTPKTGDNGLMVNGVDVPLSPPVAYTPCRGELGVVINDTFQPLYPPIIQNPNLLGYQVDTLAVSCIEPYPATIPWIAQTSIAVAQPIVFPYNWANVTTFPTLILDTEPDATASAEDKALPNYFPNPGLTIRSKTHYDFDLNNYDDETGVGYYWTWGASPAFPKPVTRTSGAVGTKYEGVPFIPAAAGTFVGGTSEMLRVCAYHHYFTIANAVYNIQVKIGRGTATWDATAKTLTFSTPTTSPIIRYIELDKIHAIWDGVDKLSFSCQKSGTVIKYSLDGSFPSLTYSAPLTITATTKVRVQAILSPAYISPSDVFSFSITFAGATPPVAFENLYTWDALEALGAASTAGQLNAFSTYATPLSLTKTTKIRWYVTKFPMASSDFWDTTITYAGATPPADFETVYFSHLPVFDSTSTELSLRFHRRADWYVSPGASGNGKDPSTPGDFATIVGLSTAVGKARGWRGVNIGQSSSSFILYATGAYSGVAKLRYSFDLVTWTDWMGSAIVLPAPGYFYVKFVRLSDGSDYTRIFRQPWFLGAGSGVQVRAVWSLSAKTLTLTYEAPEVTAGSFVVGVKYRITKIGTTNFILIGAASNTVGVWFTATGVGSGTGTATMTEAEDIYLQYSLDTDTPHTVYPEPLTIAETCIPKVRVQHPSRNPHDFATQTGIVTLPTINPASTADFNNVYSITFTNIDTMPALAHRQPSDVVWCSEGTYSNPSGTASIYFQNTEALLFGGYSSDFTKRDVKNRKSIIKAVGWNDGTATAAVNLRNIVSSYLDGFWGESDVVCKTTSDSQFFYSTYLIGWLFSTGTSNNCHVYYHDSFTGGAGGSSGRSTIVSVVFRAWPADDGGAKCIGCTADIDVDISDAGDGSGTYGGAGCAGGRNSSTIAVANYGGITQQNCNFKIKLSQGRGGDGYNNTAGAGGGQGGSGSTNVSVGAGLNATLDVDIAVGRGGDGGNAVNNGGEGGTISAGVYVNNCIDAVSSVSASAGRGGHGGIASTTSAYGLGGSGGSSNATVQSTVGRDSLVTIDCTSGAGGDRGTGYTNGSTGGADSYLICSMSNSLDSVAVCNCDSGNGGSGIGKTYARVDVGSGLVRCTLDGHATCGTTSGDARGYLIWGASPCFFEAGDINFTESNPYLSGNPVRVDHAAASTTGWYSGLDNGNGAPLPGYTTPKGTGIALGRYWE